MKPQPSLKVNTKLIKSSSYNEKSNTLFFLGFLTLMLVDILSVRFFDLSVFESCVVFLLGSVSTIFTLEAAVRLKIL